MENMFKGCTKLTSFDFSGFVTSEVSNMNRMFSGAFSFRELNLINFHTRNIYSCVEIWDNVTKLNIKIDVSKNLNIVKKYIKALI